MSMCLFISGVYFSKTDLMSWNVIETIYYWLHLPMKWSLNSFDIFNSSNNILYFDLSKAGLQFPKLQHCVYKTIPFISLDFMCFRHNA